MATDRLTTPANSAVDRTLVPERRSTPVEVEPARAVSAETTAKQLVIINWSGELDRIWPTLIMSSTAAASGYKTSVFITFWGLLPFVKDQKRVVGENWMQRMLTLMQRPGISHLKLSKMNFLGMGPWMIGTAIAGGTTWPGRRSCSRQHRSSASSSSPAR